MVVAHTGCCVSKHWMTWHPAGAETLAEADNPNTVTDAHTRTPPEVKMAQMERETKVRLGGRATFAPALLSKPLPVKADQQYHNHTAEQHKRGVLPFHAAVGAFVFVATRPDLLTLFSSITRERSAPPTHVLIHARDSSAIISRPWASSRKLARAGRPQRIQPYDLSTGPFL